jgi:hypothetical protein
VSDVRTANAKHKNNALNRTLQNYLFSMVGDENETAARKSLDVLVELYRRHVWCAPAHTNTHMCNRRKCSRTHALSTHMRMWPPAEVRVHGRTHADHVVGCGGAARDDAKTVNVIATAALSPRSKLCVPALQFFLSADRRDGQDESDQEEVRVPPPPNGGVVLP